MMFKNTMTKCVFDRRKKWKEMGRRLMDGFRVE